MNVFFCFRGRGICFPIGPWAAPIPSRHPATHTAGCVRGKRATFGGRGPPRAPALLDFEQVEALYHDLMRNAREEAPLEVAVAAPQQPRLWERWWRPGRRQGRAGGGLRGGGGVCVVWPRDVSPIVCWFVDAVW